MSPLSPEVNLLIQTSIQVAEQGIGKGELHVTATESLKYNSIRYLDEADHR
jgi:hypothetical protein